MWKTVGNCTGAYCIALGVLTFEYIRVTGGRKETMRKSEDTGGHFHSALTSDKGKGLAHEGAVMAGENSYM